MTENFASFVQPESRAHGARRGLSIVLVCISLIVLVGFVSLAVDFGRVKLARNELQTAADAAALAGASGLEFAPDGMDESIDRALDTAGENVGIDVVNGDREREDHSISLVADEDIDFGIWRPETREFEQIDEDFGDHIDERRRANAVRVWARRCTEFVKKDMFGNESTLSRGNGLPLIFAPALPDGPLKGEMRYIKAVAKIEGGRRGLGFVGLDWIRFTGTVKADSYDAATENYPGTGGPNDQTSISSNGDITLIGTTDIFGDVHPGVESDVIPKPLQENVDISGYIQPVEEPIVVTPPTFSSQTSTPDTDYVGTPTEITTSLFKSWTTKGSDVVTINNDSGPVNVWVNGNFNQGGNAQLRIKGSVHPVNIYVNGDIAITGGNIVQPPQSKPSLLTFHATKADTDVEIKGVPLMSAHINAPLSDVTINGSGKMGFYGWIIGKTLTAVGTVDLHYDQSNYEIRPWSVRLVD